MRSAQHALWTSRPEADQVRTVVGMRTVVLGPPPAELEAFLSRRRELGLDA